MKKIISMLLIIALMLTFGCAKDVKPDIVDSGKNIALITGVSGKDDEANKELIEAFDEINEYYLFKYDIIELSSYNNATSRIESVFEHGYDLIISADPIVNEKMIAVSTAYPDQLVSLVDSKSRLGISMNFDFQMQDASFLAGYYAATMSETDIIAYIGVEDSDDEEYRSGYYVGAKTASPNVVVLNKSLKSYTDIEACEVLTDALAKKNVDYIFTNCGASALGVVEIAKQNDIKLINSEQYEPNDDSSYVGRITKSNKKVGLYLLVAFFSEDFVKETIDCGVAFDMVDFTLSSEPSDELMSTLAELRNQIREYDVKIPRTIKEAKTFNYEEQLTTDNEKDDTTKTDDKIEDKTDNKDEIEDNDSTEVDEDK